MRYVHESLALTTALLITSTVFGEPAGLRAIAQQQIELRLHDAVFPVDIPDGERSPAIFLLRRAEDGRMTAWGTTRGINHNVQRARLSDVVLSDTRLALNLDVTVFADARGNGPGHGTYRIELSSEPDGAYQGSARIVVARSGFARRENRPA
jgi:hypothetical protein